ncbi:hypothetical protein [Phreatobacter sp.]|uniref:hypothetical protein n=1 Tax=Phreatobacter sp. TaxID=1966341 RepID=UPI003F6E9E49
MTRLPMLLLAALVTVMPAFATAVAARPAAGPDPRVLQEAISRFMQLSAEAERNGTLPRLSDREAWPILQSLWDRRIVAPDQTFDRERVLALAPFCVTGGQVVARYVTFRTRGFNDPAAAGNLALFQPEIATGMDFTLRCSIVLLEWGASHFRNLPPERLTDRARVDFDDLRRQVTDSIIGALGLIRERRFHPGSATRIARALRESTPRLVASLEVSDRTALAAFARDALPSAGPLAEADLEAFIAALGAR